MKEKTLLVLIGLWLGLILTQSLGASAGAGWTNAQVERAIFLLEKIADK